MKIGLHRVCIRQGRTAAPRKLGRRGGPIACIQAGAGRAMNVRVTARATGQGQQIAAAAVHFQLVQGALALSRETHSRTSCWLSVTIALGALLTCL